MEDHHHSQKMTFDAPPKKKRRISAVIDEKGFRLRSGCFPIRINPETNERETLLITCRNRLENLRWCIPSGPIDPGEIAAEAATRGTREEAGVIGRLRDPERPLGVWTNHDRRSKTSLFVLDVTQELIDKWEGSDRDRKWFTIPEAQAVLAWKPLNLVMLNSLKERLGLVKRVEERPIDNLLGDVDGRAGAVAPHHHNEDGGEEVVKTAEVGFHPQTTAGGHQTSVAVSQSGGGGIQIHSEHSNPPSLPLAVKLGGEANGLGLPQQRVGHGRMTRTPVDEEEEEEEEEEDEEEEEEGADLTAGLLSPTERPPQPRHMSALRLQTEGLGTTVVEKDALTDSPVVYLRSQPLDHHQHPQHSLSHAHHHSQHSLPHQQPHQHPQHPLAQHPHQHQHAIPHHQLGHPPTERQLPNSYS